MSCSCADRSFDIVGPCHALRARGNWSAFGGCGEGEGATKSLLMMKEHQRASIKAFLTTPHVLTAPNGLVQRAKGKLLYAPSNRPALIAQ